MIEEDRRAKEALKEKAEKLKTEDIFQQNMGGHVIRRKMDNYIRKVTIGHVAVLDPTGRKMRIDPSKVTVQKTMAFGIGQASPEEIASVEEKLKQDVARINKLEREDKWRMSRGEEAQDDEGIRWEENETGAENKAATGRHAGAAA